MLKQIVALIVLSLAIVLAMSYAQFGMQMLLNAHDWISQLLTDVFTVGQAGNIFRGLIALLTIPVIAAAIPTLAYWALKRNWFPYFLEIVWVVWLVQAGAILVARTAA